MYALELPQTLKRIKQLRDCGELDRQRVYLAIGGVQAYCYDKNLSLSKLQPLAAAQSRYRNEFSKSKIHVFVVRSPLIRGTIRPDFSLQKVENLL